MRNVKGIISVLLSIILISATCSVALPVFAYEILSDNDALTKENNLANERQTEIISEVKELREEYVKHFKMSDGTYQAVVYSSPVHYKENGKWQEIDTGIKESTSATKNSEKFYANVADTEFLFPDKITNGELIKIKKNGNEISFGYKENIDSVFSSAVITESSEFQKYEDDKKTDSETLKTEVSQDILKYNNVSGKIDFEYELNSSMLKESIIIPDKQEEYVYEFSFNIGELTPVANQDGSISLIDKENNDSLEYVIASPFMIDANGIFSDSVTMTMTLSDGEYILTVTADENWLNDESREFPVVIDPTLLYKPDRVNDIFDTYTDSGAPTVNHYLSTYAIIGHNSLGTGRTYIKFNLPSLPHCGVIINATLGLLQMGFDPGNGVTNHMVVYESPASQNYQTLTWNNQPSLDNQPIVDYTEFISGSNGSVFYTLDITKIAKKWFEDGINNGLFLASANESSSWRSTIYTSNYTGYDVYPMISISYMDNKGIEDYWSYETIDMGRSGTVFINEYNGLLTYVHTDIALGGNITSLTASHIYSNEHNESGAPYGYGFRVSAQEKISLISSGDLYDEGYRAYLTDADGTVHYFKYENSSTMKYEFDDNLILKSISGQTYKYELQYEDGSKRRYDSSGKLLSISDSNGNTITYTYDSSGRINKITDAANRSVTYNYDSSGYLSSFTDAAGRNTVYSYDNGYLRTITYPDGKTTVLTYLSEKLFNIKQVDSTNVSFLYRTSDRVNFISVKGTDSAVLKTINFSFQGANTVVSDSTGRSVTVGFDNMGRAVSRSDNDGNISTAKYASEGNKNNKMTENSDVFSFSDNKLLNHSFEAEFSDWKIWKPSGTNSHSVVTSQAFVGSKSLKLTCSAEGKIVALQDLTDFEIGKEYTLSAYVKATSLSGTKTSVRIEGKDSSGTVSRNSSPWINAATDGWVRLQVSYTVPAGVTYIRICLELQGASGTVYYDALQFEEASAAGHYNLLTNPGFERHSSNTFSGWTASGTVSYASGIINTSGSVGISGSPSSNARLVQSVIIGSSSENRTLIFGGAVKGNCAATSNTEDSNAKIGLLLELYSGSSLVSSKNIDYNPYAIETVQLLTDSITANSSVNEIKLYLLYDKNVNTSYFDNMFIYIDNYGTKYEYNADGKLIKQSNDAGDAISYTYLGADITKISITKDGEEKDSYTYTYDDNHNILTETTKDGIITTYTYPESGNRGMPTSVTVRDSAGTLQSSLTYTYSSNYNYIRTVTDARGNTTLTVYSPTKGYLTSETDANGIRYIYSHDAYSDELLEVYTENDDGFFDVVYRYNDNGQLSSVEQDNVTYSLTYDNFSRRTSTKVGSQTLASYSYNVRGLLGATTYGNGTIHSLTYDNSDRIISEAYDGTVAYSYAYNTEGYLGKVTDHELDITTYYDYDLVGRVTDVDSTDGVSSDFSYNEYNSIASYSVKKDNSVVSAAEYTYTSDGLPETVELAGFQEPEFLYAYDELNRRTDSYHFLSGSPIKVEYSYLDGEDSETTGLVSNILYSDTGYRYMPKLSYTYDAKGNIRTVSENDVLNLTYTYDSLDRLVREDNKDLDETIVYTYDERGNILSKKYYDYTTGDVGALNDEIIYSYDSVWKDKLISYNGLYIEYDSIGNPTVYRGIDLNWQKGRQLESIGYNGTELLTFEYNAEGLRTKKSYYYGDTTTYTWSSGLLMQQTDGTNTLKFSYSPDGRPLGVIFNGTSYYYIYNLQGDVIGIYDYLGSVVVEYTYDSWGNITDTEGSLAYTLGNLNPFRYRGYIYDEETGLYWLRSRYYDPMTGRFLNGDIYVSTGQGMNGYNMFAYCGNNPVKNSDCEGECYYNSCGRWSHDNWENIGDYEKKPEPNAYTDKTNSGKNIYISTESSYSVAYGDVQIIDKRDTNMTDGKHNPDIKIINSYLINNENVQKEIIRIIKEYNQSVPSFYKWERSEKSLLKEWEIHNTVCWTGFAFDNTAHVDFDVFDEGKGYIAFCYERIIKPLWKNKG